MPPKRKAPAPKKKVVESPPPSESDLESESEIPSEPESEPESESDSESPKPKKKRAPPAKPKAPPKPKAAPAPKKSSAPPAAASSPAAQKKQPPVKKSGSKAAEVEASGPPPQKKTASKLPKRVVIEHCKQCQSFKRTATKLEGLLKKAIPDLEVVTNPDKPRKGIFEVRSENGEIFVSLQGLVRPFKKMKELDLEETADNVVSKLN